MSGGRAGTHYTHEPERRLAERLEAVQLVAGDVHDIALADLVRLVAERDPRPPRDDHHAVVVGVALARSPAAGRNLEVAHPVLAGALGLADQLVLADPGERRVVVGLRLDALPAGPSLRPAGASGRAGAPMDHAHGAAPRPYAAAGVTR